MSKCLYSLLWYKYIVLLIEDAWNTVSCFLYVKKVEVTGVRETHWKFCRACGRCQHQLKYYIGVIICPPHSFPYPQNNDRARELLSARSAGAAHLSKITESVFIPELAPGRKLPVCIQESEAVVQCYESQRKTGEELKCSKFVDVLELCTSNITRVHQWFFCGVPHDLVYLKYKVNADATLFGSLRFFRRMPQRVISS